jgi:hypothetical protein
MLIEENEGRKLEIIEINNSILDHLSKSIISKNVRISLISYHANKSSPSIYYLFNSYFFVVKKI